MAENSAIEWTDHTLNPWRGCTKVAPECANCYAETMSKRNPATLGVWGQNGTRVVAAESYWKLPLRWDRAAECCCRKGPLDYQHEAGCPQRNRPRVFCASLADVFEDWRGLLHDARGEPLSLCLRCGHHGPFKPDGRDRDRIETACIQCGKSARTLTMADVRRRLFALIDATPNLDWLLLTKRPENIRWMWPTERVVDVAACYRGLRAACAHLKLRRENVWLGTSAGTQETADKAIPELLRCRDLSPVLFVSAEPLLEAVDLHQCGAIAAATCTCSSPWATRPCRGCADRTGAVGLIDWIIAGGESGPGARPMHQAWARSIRDQCQAAGVPFFFKQWGEWLPESLADWSLGQVHEWCEDETSFRHGYLARKYAPERMRLLDGREHNELPTLEHAR